ncbi:MAG: acetyl-CoA carboxylase biotin carboxyl carrier protein, partial [Thermoguttaceae bacterium]|nr:acetyl-CoA carboxylase biotin carboxyl carrier protein [Thermoguttaceae bacterium]
FVRRGGDVVAIPAVAPVAQAAPVCAPAQAAPSAPAAAPAAEAENVKTITSPMVGTFYVAPKPDAAPFVKVGDRVTASTVVCVIEAMKTYNNIEAQIEGTIVEVLAKDGAIVDFGAPLFKVSLG